LDPNLRIESWTKVEDDTILNLYKVNGPKWSTIASSLAGRSVIKSWILEYDL